MHNPLRVLIAGGGIAALELVLALRELADRRVDIALLTPGTDFVYRPLAVAEPFGIGVAHHFDLGAIAADTGLRLHDGALTAVDSDARRATSTSGEEIPYDVLVVTTGANRSEGVAGALTLTGGESFAALKTIVDEVGRAHPERLAFAVPGGITWPLPVYELALLTATHLEDAGRHEVEILVVTPEDEPLAIFGTTVSAEVAGLLAGRGIGLHAGTYPVAWDGERLEVKPGAPIAADRVVSLPRLSGPGTTGLPCDENGFLPADAHGKLDGLDDVYAAGDATTFPVKQGGIAAQQADVIATSIAAAAGVDVVVQEFDPVLRGLLLTGSEPSYLRAELAGGRGERSSEYSVESPWWPPSKVVGRHLSHYLARRAAAQPSPDAPFLRIETDDLTPYLHDG